MFTTGFKSFSTVHIYRFKMGYIVYTSKMARAHLPKQQNKCGGCGL